MSDVLYQRRAMPAAATQTSQRKGKALADQRNQSAASCAGEPQTTQLKGVTLADNRNDIAQRKQTTAKSNGLPAQLKNGIEQLSGMSMDHVNVHYNSAKPAQLNAHAYAQGSDIHLAAGQEKHLPHEAWHVVQQAQGRVKPTMQMKGGVAVNDSAGLEREADLMGAKADNPGSAHATASDAIEQRGPLNSIVPVSGDQPPVQRTVDKLLAGAAVIGGGALAAAASAPLTIAAGTIAAIGGAGYLAHQYLTGGGTPTVEKKSDHKTGKKKKKKKKNNQPVQKPLEHQARDKKQPVEEVPDSDQEEVPDAEPENDVEQPVSLEPIVSPPSAAVVDEPELSKKAKYRLRQKAKKKEAKEQENQRKALVEQENQRRARAARENRLSAYPLTVTRKDTNFSNAQNSRGQGKAHLVPAGLRPAGYTSTTAAEQLVQDSPNKGSSDRISFTGPKPNNPQVYGQNNAPTLTLKFRKLARAKEKGKADVANISLNTSKGILESLPRNHDHKKLSRFTKKDDEHQVKVTAGAIPKRFLHGAGLDEEHDSDSDSDS